MRFNAVTDFHIFISMQQMLLSKVTYQIAIYHITANIGSTECQDITKARTDV